ncbi:MAG: penicillin acylase family protein, partial [Gemmatirosa sp.]
MPSPHLRHTALGAALLVVAAHAASAQSPRADTLRAPGLRAPVTLLRDSAGVVHVRAANEHDLFYAQGWSAARDRLFQLEMWRRQATGTMAEALGPRWAARDHGARLFRHRGDMARELAHYHPRGASIVQAFVDGVNAWVERAARDTALLPPELRRLGITPGRWTPAIVVSRHNALVGNAETEIDRARAVQLLGADRVAALGAFGPGAPMLAPDSALDVAVLSDSALALFRAFRAPVSFAATDLAVEGASSGERRAASEDVLDA